MALPLELAVALRYLRPRRTFVSVITVLSVLGVTLAVMVLIVVLSVMAGFEKELQDKIIGFNAHLVVRNGGIIDHSADVLAQLQKEPGVLGAAPFVTGPVFAKCAGRISAPILRGIDPEAEETVLPLRKYLAAGNFELRGDTVLVGAQWARQNQAWVGDKILIYGPRQLQSLEAARDPRQAVILPTELLITGIFETGLYDYDLDFIIVSLETAQYLYTLPDGSVHGIALRAADPLQLDALRNRLNHDLPKPLAAQTWMDQNKSLFTAIATERVAMAFILFFIMIVAAFGLCSTLITITVQKAREIGLLKALGAADRQVLGIFVAHGLLVGILGAVSGVAMAALVLYYRNPFREFLDKRLGIDVFAADIYNFATIPAQVSFGQAALIAGTAIIVCVVAALIPAQAAARLEPAKALRYE